MQQVVEEVVVEDQEVLPIGEREHQLKVGAELAEEVAPVVDVVEVVI